MIMGRDGIICLVFINDSLGELDWIAPFVNRAAKENYSFLIYLNLPGKSVIEKQDIYSQYFADHDQIILLNSDVEIPSWLATLDRYLNSILRRISGKSYMLFLMLRFFTDLLRKLLGGLMRLFYVVPGYDILMRDYNLKDSFALAALSHSGEVVKTCIFPHSTAIQSNKQDTAKRPPKMVNADLFLENTSLSTQFSESYSSVFVACGSPQIEEFVKGEKSLADFEGNSILFITRNCDPRFFGFSYESAGVVFKDALTWANNNNIHVFVKHHPRDSRLDYWRSIQSEFDNVTEVMTSLNSFSDPISFAFCFYTSACLLLTSRGVPVFDVSPYAGDVKNLPFHYLDDDGDIIHELIEYRMCGRVRMLEDFFDRQCPSYLQEAAVDQLQALLTNFPIDTYAIIDASLKRVINNRPVVDVGL